MEDVIAETVAGIEQPTVPGWYHSADGADYMIYLLNGNGDWYAITMSGEMSKCAWGYIEQAGAVEPLSLVPKG